MLYRLRLQFVFALATLLLTASAACGSDDSGTPPADSGGGDAGDTGTSDTGSGDSSAGDTGSGDSSAGDTGTSDTGSGDSSAGDTGSGDASGSDSGSTDASTVDSATADSGSGGCTVNCDCPQGQRCTRRGTCVAGIRPVYCCDSAGCPTGAICTDVAGEAGTCPDVATECAMAGGRCVVQFSRCPRGTTLDATLSCGGVRALQCCTPISP